MFKLYKCNKTTTTKNLIYSTFVFLNPPTSKTDISVKWIKYDQCFPENTKATDRTRVNEQNTKTERFIRKDHFDYLNLENSTLFFGFLKGGDGFIVLSLIFQE